MTDAVADLNKLLKMHRQMADMMKKMGKMGGKNMMRQMGAMFGGKGGLPGGGGTPLAAGMMTAFDQAQQATRRGLTPTIAVLTDGRANIALDGSANRQMAGDDAQRLARICAGEGFPGLVIDTSVRPQPALATLAQTMPAPYLAMPRADAHRMSAAVSETLDA